MRAQSEHLLIQGQFDSPPNSRFLRILTRVLAVLLLVSVVVTLAMYGVKVHYEDGINKLARNARELNEQNKELQVRLNHIRSYKNVEAAAAQVPHLHMPAVILDVPAARRAPLPPMPRETKEFPRVYGY